MKMSCITCGREVNLDHVIFQNYEGPVKCFSCGTMMEVKTAQGIVDNVTPLGPALYKRTPEQWVNRPNQKGGIP
jgi:transcription elongation GreA/GreB family factor